MTLRYSIVIVSYNGLGHLQACVEAARLCLESEAQRGDAGEIIVVDNASRDGTPSWLPGQRDIQSILNPDNRGFSVACNQGAELAAGEYLLFLNPDTWMTTGCLRRMASHFADGKVGAVGPLSNYVAGLQRLDLQWPEKAEPLAEIAAKHQDGRMKAALIAGELAAHRDGQYADTRLLIGFCLMMRRRQFASMGGMDADLFLGNDDLDLSWRLREQGFQLRVALDAFVLHEGQKSFATEPKTKVDKWCRKAPTPSTSNSSGIMGGPIKFPRPRSSGAWIGSAPARMPCKRPRNPTIRFFHPHPFRRRPCLRHYRKHPCSPTSPCSFPSLPVKGMRRLCKPPWPKFPTGWGKSSCWMDAWFPKPCLPTDIPSAA